MSGNYVSEQKKEVLLGRLRENLEKHKLKARAGVTKTRDKFVCYITSGKIDFYNESIYNFEGSYVIVTPDYAQHFRGKALLAVRDIYNALHTEKHEVGHQVVLQIGSVDGTYKYTGV